jgi:hypothetical protein
MGLEGIKAKLNNFRNSVLDKFHIVFAKRIVRNTTILFIVIAVVTPIATMAIILGGRETVEKASVETIKLEKIANEDIFMPDEPDFLPQVILHKEQKRLWTDKDAELFWRDPLEGGPDFWKNKIGESVDKLLENVP